VLVFYAIRGIFLLLGEAFKGLMRTKPKPAPRRPAEPSARDADVSTPAAAPKAEATANPEAETKAQAPQKKTTAKRTVKPKSGATDRSGAGEAQKTATTQRKTTRRGIRLKVDNPSDSD
jgi:hypothetical protein